jgi:hypothetical protein
MANIARNMANSKARTALSNRTPFHVTPPCGSLSNVYLNSLDVLSVRLAVLECSIASRRGENMDLTQLTKSLLGAKAHGLGHRGHLGDFDPQKRESLIVQYHEVAALVQTRSPDLT